jgi:cytochrome P450 family 110
LVLATILSRYRLELASSRTVRPVVSSLSLVPDDGVKMVFLGRRTSTAASKQGPQPSVSSHAA